MAEEKENKAKEAKVEEPKKPEVAKVDLKKRAKELTSNVIKVDLGKPQANNEEVDKPADDEVIVVNEEPKVEAPKEETESKPTIEDVTNEIPKVDVPKVDIPDNPVNNLPEKLQKVAEFMNETGGDLKDFVNLNRDISKMDDADVLDEYYRSTKSHLTPEERSFILEEKFSYNKDEDDPKDIKRKKIALKEQVAEARSHLDGQKSKYYENIKAGTGLTEDQKTAINFYNKYNKESAEQNQKTQITKEAFLKQTENVFNEDFKGFDYQIGDKKFRFNVKDVEDVKNLQSDLNNFVGKFSDENRTAIQDPTGYHKSLFTAMNADTIAKHFYEQGRADAIKDTVAKDKNIDLNPRQTHGDTNVGGMKVRAVGDSSADFKFKIKKNR
mgnify:CR=1 FL=1|tara:strand:+ start:2697 stop:3845 length:1149 start_codon:yes stop_codon:yes gene_type:complete